MSKSPLQSRIRVSEVPIEAGTLAGEVGHPGAGAVVVFLGTVRDHSPGKAGVTHLEYEAYREQVERKIADIVDEAGHRWPLLRAVVEHRIGEVEVGKPSVGVAVSSAHRVEAFEAARYLIDELKQRAPIWKKEHWPGGAEWVEGS
jgi:molybdopterin synthase catalytic subunit